MLQLVLQWNVVQLELFAGEGLTKTPIRRSHIVRDNRASIACFDIEREGLTIKVRVALPILAPVARQLLPVVTPRAFDRHRNNITSTANISYQHQVEVWVSVNSESYSTTLSASNPVNKFQLVSIQNLIVCGNICNIMWLIPSVLNRDNPCFILSNALKDGLGEIKMLQWRITPPSIIVRKCTVWRTEISCSDNNGSWEAPLSGIYAFDFKASSTGHAIVEQGSAQSSCVCPITLTIQISIPTSSSCTSQAHQNVKINKFFDVKCRN